MKNPTNGLKLVSSERNIGKSGQGIFPATNKGIFCFTWDWYDSLGTGMIFLSKRMAS